MRQTWEQQPVGLLYPCFPPRSTNKPMLPLFVPTPGTGLDECRGNVFVPGKTSTVEYFLVLVSYYGRNFCLLICLT